MFNLLKIFSNCCLQHPQQPCWGGWDRSDYSHFADEKTGSKRMHCLPEVTELASGCIRLNSELVRKPTEAGGMWLWMGELVQLWRVRLDRCGDVGSVLCTFASCCLDMCLPITEGLRYWLKCIKGSLQKSELAWDQRRAEPLCSRSRSPGWRKSRVLIHSF